MLFVARKTRGSLKVKNSIKCYSNIQHYINLKKQLLCFDNTVVSVCVSISGFALLVAIHVHIVSFAIGIKICALICRNEKI